MTERENLVGYLIGALDVPEGDRVAAALRADARLRADADALSRALAPLAADGETPEPPAGLAERTLARVRRGSGPLNIPRRLWLAAPSGGDRPPARSRRADVVLAAAIMLASLMVALPLISGVRAAGERAACEDGLRELHAGLQAFADQHAGRLPKIGDAPPHNTADAYVTILRRHGAIPASWPAACPGEVNSSARPTPYSYTLGYRDAADRLHGVTRRGAAGRSTWLPVAADPAGPHAGGHNVLYLGGQVTFCTTAEVGVGGDHIYRNDVGRVAAGVHRWDAVLGRGGVKP